MNLGSRLVVPGALLGSILLAAFLLLITAGASYPPPALAAAQETPAPNQPAEVAAAGTADELDPLVEIAPDGPAPGCDVSSSYPAEILNWCALITRYANERGLSPDLIAALIWQESGGNPLAYSKSGAVGLMQVMPNDGIAASFMCKNGPCFTSRPSTQQLQDPEFNIAYGTRMLAELLNKHGNLRDALKAYGPMNVGYYYADIVLGIFANHGG
jgi:soluble lytic murein transglycosylase-like protein